MFMAASLNGKIDKIMKQNEDITKIIKENHDEIPEKIIWMDSRNEKRTENIIKAIGVAHKRSDLKTEKH